MASACELTEKRKIFCIGSGKTGTTSLGRALQLLGFKLGDQGAAELLLDDWARRDFSRIIRYCHTGDAFQDIPFCLDHTYNMLDYAFPGSKFILTIRNTAEEWYESLVRFHGKLVGKNRTPTADDLKGLPYHYLGWMWRAMVLVYGDVEATLYDRQKYIDYYENHRRNVLDYFRHRPHDLLVLNVAEPQAMADLCDFLGVPQSDVMMPHLNTSRC
jgi:hypothetical protein